MTNRNRGQAAIEFLSTYGWAVLVIALVLAALVWLGVFNVQRTVPDSCSFEGGSVECNDLRLTYETASSSVRITSVEITNRLSETVYVCGVLCTNNLASVLEDLGSPSIPSPTECATQFSDTVVIQPGKRKQIGPTSAYSATLLNLDYCYQYFADTLTSNNYMSGDKFVGSLVLFYSLASDAGSSTKARMMFGNIVTTVE